MGEGSCGASPLPLAANAFIGCDGGASTLPPGPEGGGHGDWDCGLGHPNEATTIIEIAKTDSAQMLAQANRFHRHFCGYVRVILFILKETFLCGPCSSS